MSKETLNLVEVSTKKEILKAAVLGGIFCFVMSFLINYFVMSMPETQMANAIGNGISGMASGIMTALCGMGLFFVSARKSGVLKAEGKQE